MLAPRRGSRPRGTVEAIVSPTVFVVETELMPLQKRQVLLLKSSDPMMFDLILDVINGLSQLRDAHTGSAIPCCQLKLCSCRTVWRIRADLFVNYNNSFENLFYPFVLTQYNGYCNSQETLQRDIKGVF